MRLGRYNAGARSRRLQDLLGRVRLGAAVLVVGVFACSRDAGGGEDRAQEDPAKNVVIARVGDREFTAGDLEFKMKVQYPGMADFRGIADIRQKEQVLAAMLDQYTWVTTGEERGLDEDAEFRRTLELSRAYILANHTVNTLVYEPAQASEEEIRRYYEENPDQFRLVARAEVSRILAPDPATVQKLRRQALGGADFEQLARTHSKDEQFAPVGGRMGTVTYRSEIRGIGRVPEINEAIMALQPGQITEPIQTTLGWGIFRVDSRQEESVRPLDEVREEISKRITTKNSNAMFATTLDSLKKELGVEVYEDGWDQYVFSLLNEDEILQLAQQEKSPEKRIRYYNGLAQRYPEGQRASQALFMVGFTYADDLKDYPQARRHFESMLEKHPESELAESARWMLENMEKGLDNLPYADTIKRKATAG